MNIDKTIDLNTALENLERLERDSDAKLLKYARPCPFCGGKDLVFERENVGYRDIYDDDEEDPCLDKYYVHCNNCGMSAGGALPIQAVKELAVRKWNHRPSDQYPGY